MKDADLSGQFNGAVTKFVNYAEARLELLQCEWAIERLRLTSLVGTMISMLFFSFLTVFLLAVLIIAWYWDSPNRLTAIVLTLAGSFVCAMVSAARYRVKHREPSVLFTKSIEECARDRRAIDTLP